MQTVSSLLCWSISNLLVINLCTLSHSILIIIPVIVCRLPVQLLGLHIMLLLLLIILSIGATIVCILLPVLLLQYLVHHLLLVVLLLLLDECLLLVKHIDVGGSASGSRLLQALR